MPAAGSAAGGRMAMKKEPVDKEKKVEQRRRLAFAAVFLIVNILAVVVLTGRERLAVSREMQDQTEAVEQQFGEILSGYERSFQLFIHMMTREIEHSPDPDSVRAYLKSMNDPLLEIEGETFDGLYMYYQGQYLYSWDTPYSVYEDSGYVATERPWYLDAAAGDGAIVFTPPYMSYANHYILTTLSQMQPDGETVFAYDIKMGDIQKLVSGMNRFDREQVMIFDQNGTVIGSTDERYLGGNFYAAKDETEEAVRKARAELDAAQEAGGEEAAKAEDKWESAAAFHAFKQELDAGFPEGEGGLGAVVSGRLGKTACYQYLQKEGDYSFLVLVPKLSMLKETVNIWLVPFLVVELLLIYLLGRVSKEIKNRELRAAYVELGQIQKRLKLALSVAQKAAAVDDLTGLMNFKSFRDGVTAILESMDETEHGILIMLDGDHFKQVNDTYGHSVGDEVIKLSAQMVIGRIRTVDLASRLHGDEFAIYVANTDQYSVAKTIVDDINKTIAGEAAKRNMPAITLSAGAVKVSRGDTYNVLAKNADAALYRAKETHDGGFAQYN